jgi:predicted permease
MFENARLRPDLLTLQQDVTGDVGKVLWVVMATIGMVLLIACANVANLLLVRVEGRQQELAIRAALGAGWTRIARDLLLESLLLALTGGMLGVALARAAIRLLLYIAPAQLPRLSNISIDPRVLLFAVAVSLVSGLLFAAIPVLKFAGPKIVDTLRGGGRTMSHSRERHRARNTLVIVQTALALVLLIAAGLMIRTFAALRQVQPGFTNPAEIQTLTIFIPETTVRDSGQTIRTMQNILDKIRQIPGVRSAAFASSAPTDGFNSGDPIYAEDHTYREGVLAPVRRFKFTAPGYFQTIGNPLLAGRDITWTDMYDRRPVAVITENLARELWRDPAAAIGKRIRESSADLWREVVGVVGDLRDEGAAEKAPFIVYWPMLMKNFWGSDFIQRRAVFAIRSSRAGTQELLADVRKAVWSVNASLPLAYVRTMDELYRGSMARTSFTLVMLAIAGGMALLLGMIGIYGAISYSVSQRTREIGIRLALGAQQGELRRMFVGHGLLLAGIGVACGLAVALALTRLMASLLFEVKPADPITYAAVSAGLAAAAVAASYVPARRASAVDPVHALRSE